MIGIHTILWATGLVVWTAIVALFAIGAPLLIAIPIITVLSRLKVFLLEYWYESGEDFDNAFESGSVFAWVVYSIDKINSTIGQMTMAYARVVTKISPV